MKPDNEIVEDPVTARFNQLFSKDYVIVSKRSLGIDKKKQMSPNTTFSQWLEQQTIDRQNQIMGNTKAGRFRAMLSMEQLRQRDELPTSQG